MTRRVRHGIRVQEQALRVCRRKERQAMVAEVLDWIVDD
jgi:hypothetical protein